MDARVHRNRVAGRLTKKSAVGVFTRQSLFVIISFSPHPGSSFRVVSSAVEHCLHTAGVTGSIPVPPTKLARNRLKGPQANAEGLFLCPFCVQAFRAASLSQRAKLPLAQKRDTFGRIRFGPAARSCGHMRGDERSSPYALRNASLSPREKSCRYKRRIAGARHARYHSWRNTKTQGYPPPGFSVRAGTRTDRLRTNLRARAGGMGTLSAVLGVAGRRGAWADASCKVRLALDAVER